MDRSQIQQTPSKRRRTEADKHEKISDADQNKLENTKQGVVDATTFDCCYFDHIINWDVKYTRKLAICAGETSPFVSFRWLLIVLEISCHGIPWLIGNAIAVLVSHQTWMHEILLNLFAALLFDVVVVGTIKAIVRRQRPGLNRMDMFATISVDKFSFPSGHTTRAGMVACFLITQLALESTAACCIVVWAVLVAVSRVMLGRHHILDVWCGVVIGIVQCVVFTRFMWLPESLCEAIIQPIQEDLHL